MGTEMAALTVILGNEQRMLSAAGFDPVTTPRETSFCTHVVASAQPLMVADAIRDPFFAGHPLVATSGSIRSYCGVPLTTADGHVAGALCVFDSRDRMYTPSQLMEISLLAQQAREILLPGAEPVEALSPALWFREDPLASWIMEHVPTEDELQKLQTHKRGLSRLHGGSAAD